MIYVHVPFCRSFCIYCDFYSEIPCGDGLFGDFAAALGREIRHRAGASGLGSGRSRDGLMADRNSVHTLYIGGGTPSVLPLSVFSAILNDLAAAGVDTDFEEFTVEANPDDIVRNGQGYAEGLAALGVNRISMGVQSFDDGLLKWMNRRHDSGTAVEACRLLRRAGMGNISIDLIFGASLLSDSMWKKTLEQLLTLPGGQPEHVSAYQLTVEPGSILGEMAAAGRYSEAAEEQCLGQYAYLCSVLRDAGYEHYEISNFSLPGYRAVHNSAYWSGCSYAGFGPGAHSYDAVRRERSWNEPSLKNYLAAPIPGSGGSEVLTDGQAAMERIMLSLRTAAGIPENELRHLAVRNAVDKMLSEGNLVRLPDGNVRIPEDRFFISDTIISEIV